MPDLLVRVGVDVEAVARFEDGAEALLTPREIAETQSRAQPAEGRAGRWCAKEAVVKALSGSVLLSPREVEVVTDADGRPRAILPPRAAGHVRDLDVSIAHSNGFAMAVAVASLTPTDAGSGGTDGTDEHPGGGA